LHIELSRPQPEPKVRHIEIARPGKPRTATKIVESADREG